MLFNRSFLSAAIAVLLRLQASVAQDETPHIAPEKMPSWDQMWGKDRRPLPSHIGQTIYTDKTAWSFTGKPDATDRTLNNVFLCAYALLDSTLQANLEKTDLNTWPIYLYDEAYDERAQADLVLGAANKTGGETQFNWKFMEVQLANMKSLREHLGVPDMPDDMFEIDIITEPWWPWFVADAALQFSATSEDSPGDENVHFEITHVMEMLSGFDAKMMTPESPGGTRDKEIIWNNYLSKSTFTPILVNMPEDEGKNQREGWYAVSGVKNEGVDRMAFLTGLFDPVDDKSPGIVNVQQDLTVIAESLVELVYLEGTPAVDHRPDHPLLGDPLAAGIAVVGPSSGVQ